MEARLVAELPDEPGWRYEPKWDGFRCLAYRDCRSIELRSQYGQPPARYFPGRQGRGGDGPFLRRRPDKGSRRSTLEQVRAESAVPLQLIESPPGRARSRQRARKHIATPEK